MHVVICGAGTAGCVVAARLSEESAITVTLLEAGPHYPPGSWPEALRHSHRVIRETHDWNFLAQAGASPRLVHVPRGRVVGGSSVTNGTIALRGMAAHYDEWARYVDGYEWATWLPWFCSIERDLQFGSADHHGDHGPIAINRYARGAWFPIMERFAQAAIDAGHPWVDDHNAPDAIGVGPAPLNMIDGVRQTPADHYLAPALGRMNLTLRTGVLVDRLRFVSGRAVGVDVVDDTGRRETIGADAVILCLGTYASPAVLIRSGVGPSDQLAAHGIDAVMVHEGVGRGMQDHPKVSYRFWLDLPTAPWPSPWIQALLTADAKVAGEMRRFQLMPYSGVVEGGHRFTDLNVQVADARGRRGRVTIQSRSPADQPVLHMGWLESDGDRDVADVAGETVMALARSRSLNDVLVPWPNIADRDHPLRTVETFHHPVGSLRMGRDDDRGAVVDERGCVRGVDGVWCIDASVIPRIPSANTHLCVLALAERLSATFRSQ